MQRIFFTLLVIFGSFITGWAITQGKIKTVWGIVVVVIALPLTKFLSELSENTRFRLLIVAVIIMPINVPMLRIPYEFTIGNLLFLGMVMESMTPYGRLYQPDQTKYQNLSHYLPYALLILAGFVNFVVNQQWDVVAKYVYVCFVPLAILFLSKNSIATEKDALRFVYACLAGTMTILVVLELALLSGNVVSTAVSQASAWRFGYYTAFLGPIIIEYHPIVLTTYLAIAFPTVAVLLVREKDRIGLKLLYTVIAILFILIILRTGALGATIASGISISIALIVLWRYRPFALPIMISVLLLILVLLVDFEFITNILDLPNEALARYNQMTWGLWNIDNFVGRIDVMEFTFNEVMKYPIGYGFYSFWHQYGLDETVMYGAILNGTGFVGLLGFMLIVAIIGKHFFRLVFNSISRSQRELVAIGLGTLISGLIVGFSSESVVVDCAQPFFFWGIVLAAYRGTSD